ncbi:MAG: CDP-alcohol phosphatidyltransferase family protein [Bacteroidetes bacterium]|nr:CDP-alcohol phosphatidyltransferase family protein [Bacteroidota bacterium]
MNRKHKEKSDCYSAGDRKLMELSQELRGIFLLPFLKILTGLRLRPNHITYLSLLCGWIASFLIFISEYNSALFLLLIHVILDGIDGPLARHQDISSNAGSFIDTLVDQIVIASIAIVLMEKGILGVFPGGVYIFVYTAVITFSMVRNAIKIPYLWMLRPRFLVYLWLVLEFTILPNTINWIVWLCNIFLIINFQDGFRQLKKNIK